MALGTKREAGYLDLLIKPTECNVIVGINLMISRVSNATHLLKPIHNLHSLNCIVQQLDGGNKTINIKYWECTCSYLQSPTQTKTVKVCDKKDSIISCKNTCLLFMLFQKIYKWRMINGAMIEIYISYFGISFNSFSIFVGELISILILKMSNPFK